MTTLHTTLATAKALSDPNRLRALAALRNQELCVCRIVDLLQLAPSTVSKHLTVLKQAGLLESRKQGRWMHYSLPDTHHADTWRTLTWLFESLHNDPQILADQQKIPKILATDVEELTRVYQK